MDILKSVLENGIDDNIAFLICSIAGYCIYKLIMYRRNKTSLSDDGCIVSILNQYILKWKKFNEPFNNIKLFYPLGVYRVEW